MLTSNADVNLPARANYPLNVCRCRYGHKLEWGGWHRYRNQIQMGFGKCCGGKLSR